MKEVSVSFLGCGDPLKAIDKLNNSNCDYIHFDVMDGKFVDNSNLTCEDLDKYIPLVKKKTDVHLMVNDPSVYIETLKKYNISYLTIHYEIKDLEKYIDLIKSYDIKVGVSIKPDTPIKEIYPLLDKIDLVLVMGVNPGYSGQTFISKTKSRINKLKKEIIKRGLDVKISVDGGICNKVLHKVSNADILVSASFVFNNLENIELLKNS